MSRPIRDIIAPIVEHAFQVREECELVWPDAATRAAWREMREREDAGAEAAE